MRRTAPLVLAGLAGLAATAAAAQAATAPPTRLAVYATDGRGIDQDVAKRLAAMLGVEGASLAPDGTMSFLDPERFGAAPMLPGDPADGGQDEGGRDVLVQKIDIAGLKAMQVLPDDEAIGRLKGALAEVGLELPPGAFRPIHTMMGVKGADGETVVEAALDAGAQYRMRLGRAPLFGPGAKLRVSFDAEGRATQLRVAVPALGERSVLPAVPAAKADRLARARFATCDGPAQGLRLRRSLVYYAAGPSEGRNAVLPFYAYRATAVVGGKRLPVRTQLLPAVQGVAPTVVARARVGDGLVVASARARGGAAPYTYAWSSCATGASGTGASVRYPLAGRGEVPPASDVLLVQVTDANGVTTVRRLKVAVPAPARVPATEPARTVRSLTRTDVGVEFIGVSGGLPGSAVSASGFRSTMGANGVPTQFSWGDSLAWESDFRSGDATYVDDVDMTFYTGHANGDGWVTSPTQGDGFVSTGEATLGDRDLEWLGIAACGPLEGIQTGDLGRWFSTFQGMHQLLGYATVTYDNTIEGPRLASYLHGDPGGIFGIGSRPPYKVWQAWAQMAIDAQSPSEVWGTMGVTGPSWTADRDEYFWGRGATGPDIRGAQRTGWWWIWGTA